MSKLLTELYPALRVTLGDDPSAVQPIFTDAQILGYLQTSIDMGIAPSCLGLSDDRLSLDPEPPNADTLGYYILKTAYWIQSSDTPVNIKTRAMSVSVNNNARRDTLFALEAMIHELESEGEICGETGSSTVLFDVDCNTYLYNAFRDCPYCQKHTH